MLANPSQIKLQVDYKFYHKKYRIWCPLCGLQVTRTRTFKTLNQLSHHLTTEHSRQGRIHPKITVTEVHEILKVIAIAMKWGLLK